MKYFTVLFVLLAPLGLSAQDAPGLRLPDTAAPIQYKSELNLDPNSDFFDGKIRIRISIKQPTTVIWLNGSGLNISEALLKIGSQTLKAAVDYAGADFISFKFNQQLQGEAELNINYTGRVRTKDSSGVFRMTVEGSKYLYTQFEAIDARDVFPCFDEPSYKVPWQLTITVPDENSVVSNTPIAKQVRRGGRVTYTFSETKPLPSYLVAFGVGPFEYVDAGKAGKNHIPVRIVTPKGYSAEAAYAASVTSTIIGKLEDYFGIPFPYAKSDQLAIPSTFGFGAMENAGLVTYSQNIILAKPSDDTSGRQRAYASVAAHELAHQWFGDLVTTAWWNDIWLNEAFATWMEQKIVREWKPEWKTDVTDVWEKLYAENEDSLMSARKVRQEILRKEEIGNAFDGITYQKGAAVIGMFENAIGEENFRKGVRSYLTQYSFRNATAPEFLDSIASASHRPVGAAFSTFLNQTGVPLVSMALDCFSKSAPVVHLSQERYVPLGGKPPSEQVWQIPVCIRYASAGKTDSSCEILSSLQQDWKLPSAGCPAWIEGNDRALGYYRVSYQGGLLSSLTSGDVLHRLTAPERADLMGNAAALANAGKMSEAQALTVAAGFAADPERQVVQRSLDLIVSAGQDQVASNLMPNYQRFFQNTFQNRARQLGWLPQPHEDDEVRLLRPSLLRMESTWGGDRQLADQARDLADKYLDNPATLDPNLVSSVLMTGAFYGDKSLVDRLLGKLVGNQDRQQRSRIINALAEFRDPAAVNAVFSAILDGRIPFIEGNGLLIRAGSESDATRMLGLQFLESHLDEIRQKAPGGSFDFMAHLPSIGNSYCDAQARTRLTSFFEPKLGQIPGATRPLAQTLERIDDCIATKAAQEQSIQDFLSKY